nr:MAG TPA: hypothetical protein [Caudoviricetes sp.]DAT10371.1 MAG TPA: hypothetical protein [Caudoviricetes sp.]
MAGNSSDVLRNEKLRDRRGTAAMRWAGNNRGGMS